MGGRENPNDLLLQTRIYNITSKKTGKYEFQYTPVESPHIISKDETSMYTYSKDEPIPINDLVKNTLNTLKTQHNDNYRNDLYPGILQLYKSFYSSPSIIDFFYQDTMQDGINGSHEREMFYKYWQAPSDGTSTKDWTKRSLSNMDIDQLTNLYIFYKLFFKCIKQGFYINDSINQLLLKFEAITATKEEDKPKIKHLEYSGTSNDNKCILSRIEDVDYDPTIHNTATLTSTFDQERLLSMQIGFNDYGWYNNSLPDECIGKSVYLNDSSGEIKDAKIYKYNHFQYDPLKISNASKLENTDLAIAEIYDLFGTQDSTIPRKYVVIGCVRDTEKFIDDDKQSLKFLETVSTSTHTTNGLNEE
jgi:hypothetical protein